MGFYSTQAKVEHILLKAAWHCGTYPLGEQGRTPLYVGLPFAWVSMEGDYIFPYFVRWVHFRYSDRYK